MSLTGTKRLVFMSGFWQVSRVDEVSRAAAAHRLRTADPGAGVRHAEELEGGPRQCGVHLITKHLQISSC